MKTLPTDIDALAATMRQPEMLRMFLHAAEQRLRVAPRDARTLWAKAQKLRELGDHAAAADAYDVYCAVEPADARGAAFARLMRGEPDGVVASGGAAPFLWIADFLPGADLAALWDRVEAHRSQLGASQTLSADGLRVVPSYRTSQTATADQGLRDFLLPKIRAAMEHHRLPARFALPDLSAGRVEMQMTSHADQEFFRLHRDVGPKTPDRALTYLLYLARPTTRYTGGDLLLVDDDRNSFTRIRPTGNALLFFPADRMHEVTQVFCDADDPLDARLSINGWFHRSLDAPVA